MKTGVLADIHEDIVSLESALLQMEKARCEEVVCLGDILGFDERYYTFRPDGEACLRLIQENCVAVVAGNHDLIAVDRIPVFTGGFRYPDQWHNKTPEERRQIAGTRLWDYHPLERNRKLTGRSLEFLQSMPEYVVINRGAMAILLSHFLYPDPCGTTTRQLRYTTSLWPHLRWMKAMECNTALAGHIHSPELRMGRRAGLSAARRPFAVSGVHRRIFFVPPVVRNRYGHGFAIMEPVNGTLVINGIDI